MPRNLTVLVLLAVAAAAPSLAQAPADGDVPLVRVMRFDGIIHAASAHAFERALDEAEEVDAELFLVELDTPGGTVDSTRTIVSAILDAEIPVCIYVTPRAAQAASGGFFLLLAADIAAMSPLTTTGAASPVSGTGETKEGDVLMKKIAEDLSALVRAAAKQRGRPVELAEQAVKEAKAWNSAEALEAGLIDLVAQDRESLLAELSGREVVRPDGNAVRLELEGYVADEHQFEFVEEFKNIILHPLVMALLLAGATLGIYVEFQHPGAILPGVVGVVCLLVFLWGSQILPVNFFALALLVLAVVLFILEIKVISFGMLTLAGLACLG